MRLTKSLLALALVAGCGASDQPDGGSPANAQADGPSVQAAADKEVSGGLTGLYEGARAEQTDQLCIIDRKGGAQFGLVVWGANLHSCSGSGEAVLEGETLRLTMAGDQACAIEARMVDGTVTLPETIPEGCSYYCGARARLGGASFARKGATAADAMQAKDLVGESLCGSGAPG